MIYPHDRMIHRMAIMAAMARIDRLIGTQDQVVDLVEVQHYGEAQRTTAIALYPSTVDQEHFQRVIDCYKFKEDQQEIKDALGL